MQNADWERNFSTSDIINTYRRSAPVKNRLITNGGDRLLLMPKKTGRFDALVPAIGYRLLPI
jgi:hypothetical protein